MTYEAAMRDRPPIAHTPRPGSSPTQRTPTPLSAQPSRPEPTRIAVLGAGHTGPVIARVAVDAGYHVSLAASGDPARIELITQVMAPGAQARWAADAVADAELVILAIPLHRFAELDPALVADRIVVDTMNYWPPVDGVQAMFEDGRRSGFSTSEIVQGRLSRSTVVKTLNHIGYHELDAEGRPAGAPDRRALGVAGDDPGAIDVVARFIERIGYDPVRLDSLRAGRLLEPGGTVFGAPLHRAEFIRALFGEDADPVHDFGRDADLASLRDFDRESERDSDRESERDSDRESERDSDRESERDSERESERDSERESERDSERESERAEAA